MNNIEKFYEDILKKINKLLDEKKFQEAIDIIEEELESPYVPSNFLEIFEEKLLQIKYDKNYFEDKNFSKAIDKNIFLNEFNNDIDKSRIIYFFEKFKEKLSENDIKKIYQILEDKNIQNEKKILILENMKLIDDSSDFIFFNSNINKSFYLNMSNINFIESIDFFQKINLNINKALYKEPTLLEIAYTIIFSFYEFYFPSFNFKYSSDEFIVSLTNIIENLLKGSKIINNNATNDILLVIEKI